MNLRPAKEADAEQILDLIRAMPELPQWNRQALAVGEPADRGDGGVERRLMIAEDEGRLIGFVQMVQVLDEAEVESIAVAADCRKQGVGRLMLQDAMRRARSSGAALLRLEVRRSNEAALRLYGKAGFQISGVRRGYYADPVEDALVLQLSLVREE